MKFSDFDQPASSSAVDAIQAAYIATFYLYRQTPKWRLLLRARLLRQYEMYLKLLVKAIDSRRANAWLVDGGANDQVQQEGW